MTEKRFTLAYEDYDWWAICDKENPTELGISGLDIVELLNELHEENKELQRHLDVMRSGALTDDKRIKELYDENEQLKQRNGRQAKRLAELYELMAKKDWESLTEIIDDFCSCEEQLQRESGTYGGLK